MSASTHSHPETQQLPGNCTMEKALSTVVDVFHQYSVRQGDLDRLSFDELNTLLNEQAPSFLQACNRKAPEYIKKLIKETDLNKDSEVTFNEFTTLLAKLADDAHRVTHGSERCGPDRD